MNRHGIANIALLCVCHLAALPSLVTSQQPPAQTSAEAVAPCQEPRASAQLELNGEPVTILACQLEKQGSVYHLAGNVEIRSSEYVVHADQATYDSTSSEITGDGHLSLDGGPHDEHITATNGTYNLKQQTGKLYNVIGSVGLHPHGRNITLISPNPFLFTGRRVERMGPTRFVIYDGTATSCTLPRPKWSFKARRIEANLGGEARVHHGLFELHSLPVFYFPFAEHPVDVAERHSGFLIPIAGQSTTKGTILGDSYYWAINRSNDLTLGAEYFSKRGSAQHVGFRSIPTQNGSLNLTYFGVEDKLDQGGQEVQIGGQQDFSENTRAVALIDYLSSFVFRLAFNETFAQAVNSEAKSAVFLAWNSDGVSLNLLGARYQNFESRIAGDEVTILHVPSVELSTIDKNIGGSPVKWGFDGALGGLSRTTPSIAESARTAPSFRSGLVGRADVRPRLSLPLFTAGWTFRPEIALRDTYYTRQQTPVGPQQIEGTPVDMPINRRDLEASLELRPPILEKIFARTALGRQFKHTVEEDFTYRYVNGIDNFGRIIRFDERDILSDTNEVEYGITNRLYLKRAGKDCSAEKTGAITDPPQERAQPCASREFISWRVAQKYFVDPKFGTALIGGRANALASSEDFTGISFLTEPRHFSPLISRLRIQSTEKTDVQWDLDYDEKKGQISASNLIVDQHFGDYFVGGSHAVLTLPGELLGGAPVLPPVKFNQFRVLVGYGRPDKRGLNAAANVGVDAGLNFLQYATVQTTYNWDCCGVTLEYRNLALGSVRKENSFSFAFTIANVGTFGNLRQRQRLF